MRSRPSQLVAFTLAVGLFLSHSGQTGAQPPRGDRLVSADGQDGAVAQVLREVRQLSQLQRYRQAADRLTDAIQNMGQAERGGIRYVQVAAALAEIHYQSGQYQEALQWLRSRESRLRKLPTNLTRRLLGKSETAILTARVYAELGRRKEAQEVLLRMLERYDQLPSRKRYCGA